MAQRVLQNTTATITATLRGPDGEVLTPAPDTAKVTITRDNGDVIATDQDASGIGNGQFTYPLTTADTALLDLLTLDWVTPAGTTRTYVEIVGGFLFSISDLQTIQLGGTKTIGTAYTTDAIKQMRTTVEETLEDACGVAFVPRYGRATVSGDQVSTTLSLPNNRVRAIRWATVDGTAVTDLTTITVIAGGYVRSSAWTCSFQNVTVGYEHGLDRTPERVRHAALLLAKVWLVSGPVDDRVTTMSSPDTGITATLAVPGRGGSVVGVPEVDAVIQQYRLPAVA